MCILESKHDVHLSIRVCPGPGSRRWMRIYFYSSCGRFTPGHLEKPRFFPFLYEGGTLCPLSLPRSWAPVGQPAHKRHKSVPVIFDLAWWPFSPLFGGRPKKKKRPQKELVERESENEKRRKTKAALLSLPKMQTLLQSKMTGWVWGSL
jgi:hypothetical protein